MVTYDGIREKFSSPSFLTDARHMAAKAYKSRRQKATNTRLTVLELQVLDGEVDDGRVFLNVKVVLGETSEVKD